MAAKRASFAGLGHSQSAISLEDLDKKDSEVLHAKSQEKTRHLLRKLSYPGEFSGDRKPIQYFGKPAPSFVRPPLRLALGPSDPKFRRLVPDVHPDDAQEARRLLTEAQGPLAEDAATLLGRSLGNLDSKRLHKTQLPRLTVPVEGSRMRARGSPIDHALARDGPDSDSGLDGDEVPEIDPWEDDQTRAQRLRQCLDADLIQMHISDFCYADEEPEVLQTLWELYGRLYETYAIFAGRSQWPMVRQVDVYAFFEEAALLDRGPLGAPSGDSPLVLQDVEQIMVQTITHPHQTGRKLRHGRPELVRHAAMVEQQTIEGAPISRPQFIEVMLRASILLFGNMPSTSQIFRRFADEIISGRIQQAPLAAFPRSLKLMQGEYMETLQAHRDTLQEARERFGANMNAFQRLAQLLKLCDRQFTAKHMASIYACARRPVVDFRSKEAHRGLGYDEFCEAVSRLAMVWQPSKGPSAMPGTKRMWPAQPVCGQPVHQRVLAARLKPFLAKMAERMRPTVRTNPSIF